jgi:hypothetical protein
MLFNFCSCFMRGRITAPDCSACWYVDLVPFGVCTRRSWYRVRSFSIIRPHERFVLLSSDSSFICGRCRVMIDSRVSCVAGVPATAACCGFGPPVPLASLIGQGEAFLRCCAWWEPSVIRIQFTRHDATFTNLFHCVALIHLVAI